MGIDPITEIINSLGLTSEEELFSSNGYGFKAVEKGLVNYEEAIALGLIEEEDVIDKIGIDKAITEGILTKAEAEIWELESNSLKEVIEIKS